MGLEWNNESNDQEDGNRERRGQIAEYIWSF